MNLINSLDCCGFVKFFYNFLKADEPIDEYEASKLILTEAREWRISKEFSVGLGDIWATLTKVTYPSNPYLIDCLPLFEKEQNQPPLAVYLGCGNSESALLLLKKNWNVIAVDNSQNALNNFLESVKKINHSWIDTRQLTLVCSNMEEFEFPTNVKIVLADNCLMHCDPLKIRELFRKIYQSLAKRGRFIGNFYLAPKYNERLFRDVFGIWLANRPFVSYLLDEASFVKEVCCYNTYGIISEPTTVEFVGLKD